jgi:4-oxalocrotonate tautomerase
MRPVTWVLIEDVKSGEWAIGGNPLMTTDGKNLAAEQIAKPQMPTPRAAQKPR